MTAGQRLTRAEARKIPMYLARCPDDCGAQFIFPRNLRCPRCYPAPRWLRLIDAALFVALVWWLA